MKELWIKIRTNEFDEFLDTLSDSRFVISYLQKYIVVCFALAL